MNARLSSGSIAYLALMLVGLLMAVYHATSDRWGNAIIAAGAAILGSLVVLTSQAANVPEPVARERTGRRWRGAWTEDASDTHAKGDRWLSSAILAGFSAALAMMIALVVAYSLVGFIGSENGNQISRWFWALSHNDLTEGVWDVPMAAFSVNLLAGLAWALVYGAFIAHRLRGPGWFRGVAFAVVPWLLSLLVFFPAVGAGFLGLDLDAGPLPIVGNLLLHLIYGATLGTVYALPESSTADSELDKRAAKLENDGAAIGLVTGLTSGLVIGAIASAIFAGDLRDSVNLTLVAGGIGTLIGGLVGPLAGLSWGERHEPI
jgi:hypothetical protein